MKNKFTVALIVVLLLLTVACGVLIYKFKNIFGPAPAAAPATATSDTVFISVPKEVVKVVYKIRQIPARNDTIYCTVHDTLYAYQKADLDTFLQVEGVDYGRLMVSYWQPPFNYFDVDFIASPLPQKVITNTVVAPCSQKWYEKKEVWAGAAVLIGGIISEARKK